MAVCTLKGFSSQCLSSIRLFHCFGLEMENYFTIYRLGRGVGTLCLSLIGSGDDYLQILGTDLRLQVITTHIIYNQPSHQNKTPQPTQPLQNTLPPKKNRKKKPY